MSDGEKAMRPEDVVRLFAERSEAGEDGVAALYEADAAMAGAPGAQTAEGNATSDREKAMRPEEITRLFVERSNAGDAEGVAALYEVDAVLAYPPGAQTVGRDAIRELWAAVLASRPRFEHEQPLPTLKSGDIALTSTVPSDGAGARAQVVRRQPDGSWLRLLDYPEFVTPAGD